MPRYMPVNWHMAPRSPIPWLNIREYNDYLRIHPWVKHRSGTVGCCYCNKYVENFKFSQVRSHTIMAFAEFRVNARDHKAFRDLVKQHETTSVHRTCAQRYLDGIEPEQLAEQVPRLSKKKLKALRYAAQHDHCYCRKKVAKRHAPKPKGETVREKVAALLASNLSEEAVLQLYKRHPSHRYHISRYIAQGLTTSNCCLFYGIALNTRLEPEICNLTEPIAKFVADPNTDLREVCMSQWFLRLNAEGMHRLLVRSMAIARGEHVQQESNSNAVESSNSNNPESASKASASFNVIDGNQLNLMSNSSHTMVVGNLNVPKSSIDSESMEIAIAISNLKSCSNSNSSENFNPSVFANLNGNSNPNGSMMSISNGINLDQSGSSYSAGSNSIPNGSSYSAGANSNINGNLYSASPNSNPNGSSYSTGANSNPNGSSYSTSANSNPNGSSYSTGANSNPNQNSNSICPSSNPNGGLIENSNPNGSSYSTSANSNPNGSSYSTGANSNPNQNSNSICPSSNPNGGLIENSNPNGSPYSTGANSNPDQSSTPNMNPNSSHHQHSRIANFFNSNSNPTNHLNCTNNTNSNTTSYSTDNLYYIASKRTSTTTTTSSSTTITTNNNNNFVNNNTKKKLL